MAWQQEFPLWPLNVDHLLRSVNMLAQPGCVINNKVKAVKSSHSYDTNEYLQHKYEKRDQLCNWTLQVLAPSRPTRRESFTSRCHSTINSWHLWDSSRVSFYLKLHTHTQCLIPKDKNAMQFFIFAAKSIHVQFWKYISKSGLWNNLYCPICCSIGSERPETWLHTLGVAEARLFRACVQNVSNWRLLLNHVSVKISRLAVTAKNVLGWCCAMLARLLVVSLSWLFVIVCLCLQMGTNKGASQTGMNAYGTRRHLYNHKAQIPSPMDQSTISLQMGTNKGASQVLQHIPSCS